MRRMRTLLLMAASFTWLGTANAETQPRCVGAIASPCMDEVEVPLLRNIGELHKKITTSSELAQRYFDQGLTLVYAFNHPEAVRAFQQAAQLDPECAMCYWGIALALGPNINAPMANEAVPVAYNALQKALQNTKHLTAKEKDYIAALAPRYIAQVVADRSSLDKAYADAMRKLAAKYPSDDDALTLFSEAVMDTTPWSYWMEAGEPKPEVKEVLKALETVIQRNKHHIGANHYYIHAVEAGPYPQKALPSADRLAGLSRASGHLVHMPAHIYLRLGMFDKATKANLAAIKADQDYFKVAEASGFNPEMYRMHYYSHNLQFMAYSAAMEGRSQVAIEAAQRAAAEITPHALHVMPGLVWTKAYYVQTLVRFARWHEVLRLAEPAENSLYERAMWHYARGYAYLRLGKVDDAQRELAALAAIDASQASEALELPFFYGDSLIRIARLVLQGSIASAQDRDTAAIKDLKDAVALQDKLSYMEPPYFYFPVRQALGRVLLAAGKYQDAEKVYQQDLLRYAHNGWSLFGLAKAYRAQGQAAKAQRIEKILAKSWKNADVRLTASVF